MMVKLTKSVLSLSQKVFCNFGAGVMNVPMVSIATVSILLTYSGISTCFCGVRVAKNLGLDILRCT